MNKTLQERISLNNGEWIGSLHEFLITNEFMDAELEDILKTLHQQGFYVGSEGAGGTWKIQLIQQPMEIKMQTLELTPNAIALLQTGTDSDNIQKTLFQCCTCNLYYCWADLTQHNTNPDICPRCTSHDLATNAETFIDDLLNKDSPTSPKTQSKGFLHPTEGWQSSGISSS